MNLSFSLTQSASQEIRRLFEESSIFKYRVKVLATKQPDASLLFELMALEEDEALWSSELSFKIDDIEVVVQSDQAAIFNGVQLDYRKPSGSEEPMFIFSKVTK
jgi:Fe-S cluster assembly iron-binding protein IscA